MYRPDATGSGVGGDWYKARGLPGGRILIALGDARGHGLDAVTLMAKLRYALGGLAYTDAPVEQLTRWLNEVACDDGAESTATAVIARYHPERSLLRWTCAGHPRPVLLRDSRATQLTAPEGGPGVTLGVMPGISYTAVETFLDDTDIVLLYSDGLTERRDTDPDEDTTRLLNEAENCLRGARPPRGHDGLQGTRSASWTGSTDPTEPTTPPCSHSDASPYRRSRRAPRDASKAGAPAHARIRPWWSGRARPDRWRGAGARSCPCTGGGTGSPGAVRRRCRSRCGRR